MTLARLPLLSLAAVSMLVFPHCILVAEPQPGEVSFLWSFDGEDSCQDARVAEIDVFLIDRNGLVEYEALHVECVGGGLTLPEIKPGTYTLFLEAYSARGSLLFEGDAAVVVDEGRTTDLGEVLLTRAGTANTGDIAFYWSFDGETDCAVAGVDEIDLELVNASNEVILAETFFCEGGGLILPDVEPGTHTLYLDAYSSTNVYLFGTSRTAVVVAGQTTDLGTIDLAGNESGGLLLDWVMPGGVSCSAADVAEVDVEVLQGGTRVAIETFACSDGGATLQGLPAGSVEVWVDGYSSGNEHKATKGFTTTIVTGEITDAGAITLDEVGDDVGSLIFDMAFLYPVNAAETDCVRAGVAEIDVVVTPVGHAGPGYETTLTCEDESGSLLVSDLAPGAYTLALDAYGVYDDADLHLYEKGPVNLTITAGQETDLGAQNMSRVQANFGDMNVTWTLDGGTCADLGITEISFTVSRTSSPAEIVDDTFTKPCANTNELRLNYVPGTYRIDATATGTSGPYSGTANASVAPGDEGAGAVTLSST
jgi:hypothetical protein